MKIGDIVSKDNYTETAIWCNKNNCHIEKQDGKYVIVANPVEDVADDMPSMEERIEALEQSNNDMNDLVLGLVDVIDGLMV